MSIDFVLFFLDHPVRLFVSWTEKQDRQRNVQYIQQYSIM